jgi:hypothetical protein
MKTRYFVKTNNGYGPFRKIREFGTHKEASDYAKKYEDALGVPTLITTN